MMMRLTRLLSRLRGPGWSIVDQSFVSAVNFLSIFLLARAMAPAEFGVFMVAYTGLFVLIELQNAFVIQSHNYGATLEPREFTWFTGMLALRQLISRVGLDRHDGVKTHVQDSPDSGHSVADFDGAAGTVRWNFWRALVSHCCGTFDTHRNAVGSHIGRLSPWEPTEWQANK